MKKLFLLAAIMTILGTLGFAQDDKKAAKLTADEIVAKHIASLGAPEDLAAVKTLIFSGEGTLTTVKSAATLAGQSQFGSEGSKAVFAIVFNSTQYPYDKVAYDGKSVTVGFPNGEASVLSNFVKAQPSVMKYGLFGGALSTGWGLLDVKGKKIRLDSAGLTKVDGKQLYKLKCSPGGDLRVSLYFDPDTFHHVMTEYEYSVQAGLISSDPTQNSASKQSQYKMKEEFGDFKAAGKLMLPHEYKLQVDTVEPNRQQGSRSLTWTIQYKDVFFNEPLQEGTFKVG